MIIPDLKLEQSLWSKGFEVVCGVDEVGRGPFAGPVVAAAVVVFGEDQIVEGVRDSKKMTENARNKAFDKICDKSSAWGVGIVSAEEIDSLGINRAVQKAMQTAVHNAEARLKQLVKKEVDIVIADGINILELEGYVTQRVKAGDLYHYSIAAASVLAKVTRDGIMRELAKKFPVYGFEANVGYGTKQHRDALDKFGPCEYHRRSYKPIADLIARRRSE